MQSRNNVAVVVEVGGKEYRWSLKDFEDMQGLVMVHAGHLARLSELRERMKRRGAYVHVLSGTRSDGEMWRYWRGRDSHKEGGQRVFSPHHRDFGGVATDVRIIHADETAVPISVIRPEAESIGLFVRDQVEHVHLDSRDLINT